MVYAAHTRTRLSQDQRVEATSGSLAGRTRKPKSWPHVRLGAAGQTTGVCGQLVLLAGEEETGTYQSKQGHGVHRTRGVSSTRRKHALKPSASVLRAEPRPRECQGHAHTHARRALPGGSHCFFSRAVNAITAFTNICAGPKGQKAVHMHLARTRRRRMGDAGVSNTCAAGPTRGRQPVGASGWAPTSRVQHSLFNTAKWRDSMSNVTQSSKAV
jgi:hypothetical protein